MSLDLSFLNGASSSYQADTWRFGGVISTLFHVDYFSLTLIRRCIAFVCPLDLCTQTVSTFALFTGPISSMLTNKYGCRPTIMLGGFIAAIGLCISYFAPSIYFLFFTFGALAGKNDCFIF